MKNLLLWIRYYLVLFFMPRLLDRSDRLTRRAVKFRDEFKGVHLDPDVWARSEAWGQVRWTNNSNDYFDHYGVKVEDGVLRLRAWHNPKVFHNPYIGKSVEVPFSTGLVSSHRGGFFEQGLYECRFKNPVDQSGNPAKGSWTAVWVYPKEQWPPEIDFPECYGRMTGRSMNWFKFTVHWLKDTKLHLKVPFKFWVPKSWSQFNVVGYEFTPTSLAFYINRLKVREIKNPLILESLKGKPYKWIIENGTQPRYKDEFLKNYLPTIMDIDYVRVYY
jgi:hypothetical protein